MTSSPSRGVLKSSEEDDLIPRATGCGSGDGAPSPTSAKPPRLAWTRHFLGASLRSQRCSRFLLLLPCLHCKLFRTRAVSSNASTWYKAGRPRSRLRLLYENMHLNYSRENKQSERWLYSQQMLDLLFCTQKGN